MGEVPVDGAGDAGFEIMGGVPVECGFGCGGVDFVAEIVTGPIGDEADQAAARAGGVGDFFVENSADGGDDVEVGAGLAGADGVGGAGCAVEGNEGEGFGVVIDEQPVAHVRAIAVDGQGFAIERVEQDEWDEFFRELPGAVVVGGVGDDGGHAVGMVPGADQVIGRGFAGGVGAARIIRCGFGEGWVGGFEGTEYFIGRDVVEPEGGFARFGQG